MIHSQGIDVTNLSVCTPKPGTKTTQSSVATAQSKPLPLWLLILCALVLGLVLSYARALSVWQKGTFFDSDDAMRLVEVRNFLHGQPWFDMTVVRLDPPHGVFMHWSRIVDVPLALLIRLFSLVLPLDMAERATRLVFPLALQALLYLAAAQLAKSLMGRAAVLPAIILTLLSGMVLSQFQPGRIHHSAPQIMLSMFMLASFIEALDLGQARHAAITGVLAALSLAIGLEALPFIVLFAGLAVALWVFRGSELRRMLLFFGLSLALALPIAYVATVGPSRWFDTVCDAYSPAYLVPGFVGAIAMLGLAAASPYCKSLWHRLGAATVAAGVVGIAAFAIKPVCFIDPYHGIDPLVRMIWLKNVIEGFSLHRFFVQDPGTATIMSLPILLGFGGMLFALWRSSGTARLRWIVMTATTLIAAGLSFWMIRMLSYASLVALFGAVWVIVTLRDYLAGTKWREAAMLAFCLSLPFSTIGWALVIPAKGNGADWREGSGCLASSAFVPLAKLPKGLVAAPIDAGSHLLALTQQSVLAAPYHRNNIGNRTMLRAMLASPAEAHKILASHHVTYVMTCAGLKETEVLAHRAPYGLAAVLISGHAPQWLEALPKVGPYQVYVMH